MPAELKTAIDVRLASRAGALTTPTAGLAPSYIQANLIVLPEKYADDFRLLCARNPVPCPLLAESASPGTFDRLLSYVRAGGATEHQHQQTLPLATDIDLRRDAPRYRLYTDGKLDTSKGSEPLDVAAHWEPDHVGFLIGCSFSFETALAEAGLAPLHMTQGRNVPMYRTSLRLCPAGVFTRSTYVVSMRAYRAADVEKVREVTRSYVATHGEPIAWGFESIASLGINDITRPEWGDPPMGSDGQTPFGWDNDDELVPVFWGCGVTPQEAVVRANLQGSVIGHAPGHMIVLDVQDHDVFPRPVSARV